MTVTLGLLGAVYKSGISTSFTDEVVTDGGAHTIYTITDTDIRFIDITKELVVTKQTHGAGLFNKVTNFTYNPITGVITFDTANNNDDVVKVSGYNFTLATEASLGFYSWKLDLNANEIDITQFGNDGWKQKILGLKEWSATAEKFYLTDSYDDLIGVTLIFQFFLNEDGGDYYYGYGQIKKQGLDTSTAEVIKENLEITGTGKIYFVS